MMLASFLFYFFAATALLSGLNVVLQKKTVNSALSLIVCLCALSMLYIQLDATFIAVIQIIIYAGAIMVLFLFVIMLLSTQSESLPRALNVNYVAIPLGILLAIVIGQAALSYKTATAEMAAPSDISAVGTELFSNYLLPFEATSILILVAVLGAVILAKKNP
ncbi:MAG TPA: NADH-quinone oxidoreductase subunit J [Acidobacteriota bacterium]|jgi:NADH-quinone oxidoreductase subunit J